MVGIMRIRKSHMLYLMYILTVPLRKNIWWWGISKTVSCLWSLADVPHLFSLPEPKVQASSSDHLLSVVRPSACPSVTISHFWFSKTTRPILRKLCTKHPYVKGILNSSNKGLNSFEKRDNCKTVRIGCVS